MLYEFNGKKPDIAKNVFLAPGCQLIGDVQVKKDANIWPNAVIRADLAPTLIGSRTNIQDNCTLHVDTETPLILGDNITVGHGAILHGCKIEDNCLIGMGATILNNAVIGRETIIGAGALIPEGKEIPSHSLVIGVPGKVVRKLTEEEINNLQKSADHYVQIAARYSVQKTEQAEK